MTLITTEAPVLRVLLIEDNVDAAESLAEVLALSGHEVSIAATGPEGVELARDLRPDVVLCDIGLPGMDGYAVARAIRSDESLRRAYVVALSGYALPEDVDRAIDAGFSLHLAKPPDLGRLEDVLRQCRAARSPSEQSFFDGKSTSDDATGDRRH